MSKYLNPKLALRTLDRVNREKRDSKSALFICLLLALVTVVLFWPVRQHGFVRFDDPNFITENPHVRSGLTWDTIKWAFSDRPTGFWRPLAQIALMLDCQLFGLNAGAHHLVSLFFHLANTLLLFLVLNRMTGARWRSAFAAALFAWHPLHVESVAWAVDLENLLGAFFWMFTLGAYARYAQGSIKDQVSGVRTDASRIAHHATRRFPSSILHSPSSFYFLSLLCFALGLMCKPIVTLPFVLLLLDYWPLKRIEVNSGRWPLNPGLIRRLLLEKLPFFALTAASCAVTFYTEKHGNTVATLTQVPLGLRLANAVVSYVAYLRKTVWPDDLAVFYQSPTSVAVVPVVGAALLLAAITVGVVTARHRRPYLAVGWFWFVGTLVPFIGLIAARPNSMADRYTYIPLIGLFILFSWGAVDLMARRSCRKAVLVSAGGLILAGCIWSARAQLRHWRNHLSLFTHAAEVCPDSAWVHAALGSALHVEGRLKDAKIHFDKALALKSDDAATHCLYGLLLADEGKLDEAASQFLIALRINPGDAEAHKTLGVILARQGRFEDAIAHFQRALELGADPVEAHHTLAMAFKAQGRIDAAIRHYRTALRMKPDSPETLNNLAWILATDREAQYRSATEAVELAEQAVQLTRTKDASKLDTLAAAYAESGRYDDAVATAKEALRLAESSGDRKSCDEVGSRLRMYEQGKPFREAALSPR